MEAASVGAGEASCDAEVRVDRIGVRVANEERSSINVGRPLLTTRKMLRWAAEIGVVRIYDPGVVSLQPFNGGGGLLGLYVARRASIFICEINGVYADRKLFASGGIPGWLYPATRRVLAVFVHCRTTAVRLLFAQESQRFVCLPARVLTRPFFDNRHIERFHSGVEEKMILGMGFPFRVKGFDILCQAFHAIAAGRLEGKLVLIGHRASEKLHAAGLVHPRIEARLGIWQPELAEWMSRCAIFALPSRTEARGRVLIEAGAASKCQVATRVDGIPHSMENGIDGFFVEKEDVGQLAATLTRLIEDAPLRRRPTDAARERMEQKFSGDPYPEDYTGFVSSALAQRRT